MKIKKGIIIKCTEGKFQCICADRELAVFAPIKGRRTSFKNMFAISQGSNDFEYQIIKK